MDGEQAVEVERAEIKVGDRVKERRGWASYRVVALSRNGQVAYVRSLSGTAGTLSIEVENLVPLEAMPL
jgi:hypothetical protein